MPIQFIPEEFENDIGEKTADTEFGENKNKTTRMFITKLFKKYS